MQQNPCRKVTTFILSVHLCSFYSAVFFPTWTLCSQQEHMSDPQGLSCPHKLACLLLLKGVNKTLKTNATPLFFFILPFIARLDTPPLIPSPCPSIVTHVFSLFTNLWSHLTSMHTFRYVKDSLFTLYGAIVLQWMHSVDSTHSAQSSICIPISELLRGRRTWDSPLKNLHKSSAHFTSRWFGSYFIQLFYAHWESSRLQPKRKSCHNVCLTVDSPINYTLL